MPAIEYKPDILGPDFGQHVFDLGPDSDHESPHHVYATLIKHLKAPADAHHAVLFVHGFSDYFFQRHVAEFFAAEGYVFYALDLRKCGRSRQPSQSAHYCTDLSVYDQELNQAVTAISADVGLPIVAMGHSTGGLILPLWLERRRKAQTIAPIVGLILNSPWLDLQLPEPQRSIAIKIVKSLGQLLGTRTIPISSDVIFNQVIHRNYYGEWDFDTSLKPIQGFPVRAAWLKAIFIGQQQLHQGLDVGVASLVLRSNHSFHAQKYSTAAARADTVINTYQIARWSGCIGNRLTVIPIKDAVHEIFLSLKPVRDNAFAELSDWLHREIH